MGVLGQNKHEEYMRKLLLVSFRSGVPAEVSALHLTVEVLQLVLHSKNGMENWAKESLQCFAQ